MNQEGYVRGKNLEEEGGAGGGVEGRVGVEIGDKVGRGEKVGRGVEEREGVEYET